MDAAGAEIGALARMLSERAPDAAGLVQSLIGVFTVRMEESGFTKGCPWRPPRSKRPAPVSPCTMRTGGATRYASWQAVLAERVASEGRGPAEADADA